MDDLFEKLHDIRLNAYREYLETNFSSSSKPKLPANYPSFFMDYPIKKRLRLCLNPFSYGLSNGNLKKLSQSDILLEEIKQIIDENFNELPPSLFKKVVSHFKAELTDPNYPVEVFISEKHAILLFGMRSSRLQLYRNTGLLKFARLKGSYCYSWTQLQELFG